MWATNMFRRLCVMAVCCFVVSARPAASSPGNDAFLSALATLVNVGDFYGCSIEVVTEVIDRGCQTGCPVRIFVLTGSSRKQRAFFADVFLPLQSPIPRSAELRYFQHRRHVPGLPRVSGTIWTGRDGRVMYLRFRLILGGEQQFTICEGLRRRHVDPGVFR